MDTNLGSSMEPFLIPDEKEEKKEHINKINKLFFLKIGNNCDKVLNLIIMNMGNLKFEVIIIT